MDIMELNDQIDELKNSVFSLSAVAGAFSGKYMESNDILTEIKANPDDFRYLFYTILGFVKDAKDQVTDLQAIAYRMMEAQQK